MMKLRSLYLSAAFMGMAAGVLCIPAVSLAASAAEVTLTPAQTRALFGDSLDGMYMPPSGNAVTNALSTSFSFFEYGKIIEAHRPQDLEYTVDNTNCLIYRSDVTVKQGFFNPAYGDPFQIRLDPVVSLSGLTLFRMSCGYSCGGTFTSLDSPWKLSCNKFSFWTDYNNGNSFHWLDIQMKYFTDYNYLPSRVTIGPNNYTTQSGDLITYDANIYQIVLDNPTSAFSVDMSHSDTYSYQGGAFVNGWLTKGNSGDSSFDNYYYFYVECPTLSDGYTDNNAPPEESSGGGSESSGGGSESSGGGSDSPNYSAQLNLILAKLDLIIENNFEVTADFSGLESRVDGANSRLDGVNSRLDGLNSRFDGVNSRLDNISGELHDLNSAPTGTLPRTGAENSEFDRQAEMYLSDIQDEYAAPENLPENVVEGSSGFLSFVRDFLVRSHLAGVLPVLALLFIVHYTIFERRG